MLAAALGALLLSAPHGGGLVRAQGQKAGGDAAVESPPRINLKPFEDVALLGKRFVNEGRIGWETTADVVATAERDDDGSLKPESVRVVWVAAGDPTLAELARQSLSALSESHMLGALEGMKAVRVAFKMSREHVSFRLDGELPSAEGAEKYATGYDMLVRAASISKRGTPEGRLYEGLRFTSDGKVFKMSFEMPRREVNRIIGEMLAKRAAQANRD